MKKKCYLCKYIPLMVLFTTLGSCAVYSPDRLNSTGVSDTYNNELENENKVQVAYTYKDLVDNGIYTLDNIPSTGNPKMLVIPVWFKDSSTFINSGDKEAVRSDIFDTFFGDESKVGWRSVSGFYKQESFNKLNLTGTVSSWWDCGYYASQIKDVSSTSTLVKEAVEWFKSENSDLATFDTDKDGYLDGVSLIYAAPDYSTYGDINPGHPYSDNMWAYSYWIQDKNTSYEPIANSFLWASYDFMYDSSRPKVGQYGFGDCAHATLDAHTYIHEVGHILGLQDYYDYAINSSSSMFQTGYEAAGVFSMQDNNVGGHDPFSKIALGWTKPYVVTDTTTITIKPNQESGDVILVTPTWNDSPFDEYFLIELYTPTGLNYFDSKYAYLNSVKYKGPTASGCRLWHVDGRISSPLFNKAKNEYYYSDDSSVGTNPTAKTTNGFEHATTNTTKTNSTEGYYTTVPGYNNYRLLQLIRKNKNDYKCGDNLTASNLFTTGSNFNVTTYNKVLVNGSKLNNGKSFNFNISFDAVSEQEATITITKL